MQEMGSDLPQEKLIVGLISFGLGLILSGHYLFGLLPIGAGVFFYVKNRAAYADLEKSLISMLGAGSSPGAGARKLESPGKTEKPGKTVGKPESATPTAPTPLENWYYEHAGAALGPFKESEIRNLVHTGEITAETLVYNPIFGDEWRTLEKTHFAEVEKRRSS